MRKITLITSNQNKIREFKLVLEPEISVEALRLEYPEIRSDDTKEIVEVASKQLSEIIKGPVVVEDSGLFIEALKGFPGTCTKYVFERIGNKGFLTLMKGIRKRKCYYKSAVACCEPNKRPVSFLGAEEGTISKRIAGKEGWGQDPIFIPKGKKKTYGQTRSRNDVNLFRKKALVKLKNFILPWDGA